MRYNNIIASALIGVSALALSAPAVAQEAEDGEIVVTAKNRAERLQDVPLSITALSSSDLVDAQVTEVRDLQKIAPNVSFSGGGRGDPTAYSMRGLTANTSDERYQGISFFLDGVALSGQLASLDIANVERVEVVKGPQSATFGRSTYSGAINFITSNPSTNELKGFIKARGSLSHKAPEASYYIGGGLEGALVKDKLWLSVAGTHFRNGAVGRTTDDKTPIGREDTTIATATLFFQPDETLSIKLRGLYSRDRDTIRLQTLQQPRDWLEAGVEVKEFERGNGSFLPVWMPDPDYNQIGSLGQGNRRQDRYFVSGVITKELDDYELSYRGGYFYDDRLTAGPRVTRAIGLGQDPVFGELLRDGEVTLGATASYVPNPTGEEFFNTSHQIMLLSPGSRPLRWRLGAYYFWENNKSYFPGQARPEEPTGLSTNDTIENVAAFGGLDWDITNALTFSFEGRYARERLSSPGVITSPIRPSDVYASHASVDFTPRVTLSYKVSPDNMLYALYSKGQKSARFSRVTVDGRDTPLLATPEQLKNFEIGSKNKFLDGALILNAAAFYQEVEDQHLTAIQRITVNNLAIDASFTGNVGSSTVYGFELETYIKPVYGLTLQAAVGYAHQEFTTKEPVVLGAASSYGFPPRVGNGVILDGLQQANVPDWTGHVAAEYVVPQAIGNFGAKFRIDGSYRSSFNVTTSNQVKVRDAWNFDTRISLFSDVVDFSLFGRNIFNQRRALSSSLAGATSGCAFVETDTETFGSTQQCLLAAARRPAEWGLEAAFRF